jgi:murein DD-endopeptidase MepM/ murein hydrolase activator NlpD
MDKLNAAKTPQEAADAWADGYERMKLDEKSGRAERAGDIYKEYTGQSAPNSPSGTQAVSDTTGSQCNTGVAAKPNNQGNGQTTGKFGSPTDNAAVTECYGSGQRGGAGNYQLGLMTKPGGEAVKAVDGGEVTSVTSTPGGGTTVIVRHDNGYYSRYGYMNSSSVSVGDKVSKGQQIGTDKSLLELGISKDPNVPNTSASENPLKQVELGSNVTNTANCTADQN